MYPPNLTWGPPKRHHLVIYLHVKLSEPWTAEKISHHIKLQPDETDMCVWLSRTYARLVSQVQEVGSAWENVIKNKNDDIVKPSDTLIESSDTVIEHSNSAIESSDIVIEHSNSAIEPGNTAIEPGDTAIEPSDKIYSQARDNRSFSNISSCSKSKLTIINSNCCNQEKRQNSLIK